MQTQTMMVKLWTTRRTLLEELEVIKRVDDADQEILGKELRILAEQEHMFENVANNENKTQLTPSEVAVPAPVLEIAGTWQTIQNKMQEYDWEVVEGTCIFEIEPDKYEFAEGQQTMGKAGGARKYIDFPIRLWKVVS